MTKVQWRLLLFASQNTLHKNGAIVGNLVISENFHCDLFLDFGFRTYLCW